MKEQLINEFLKIYNEETIDKIMFVESHQYIIIQCQSGFAYKVEYNNGNITTTCLNY